MEENIETEDSGQSKTELSVDIAEEEEKTQVNVEVLDDAETVAPEQPVYQIRPQLHEKFKPLSAKEVIHNVLFDQLSAKTYDAQEAIQWTKDIADIIRDKVKGHDILCGYCVRSIFLLKPWQPFQCAITRLSIY